MSRDKNSPSVLEESSLSSLRCFSTNEVMFIDTIDPLTQFKSWQSKSLKSKSAEIQNSLVDLAK
jgi:hypothetical protein